MVPSVFVPMDALPLTSNGKVDRRALPAPDVDVAAVREYVAPSTPTEEMLARIWAEVLGRERVGVEDGFFDLGGDSILSIQIIARARAAGLVVSPKDIFQAPTVAALAQLADAAAAQQTEAAVETGPDAPADASRDGLDEFGWGEDDLAEIMARINESEG